jgi:hypothetical protein
MQKTETWKYQLLIFNLGEIYEDTCFFAP